MEWLTPKRGRAQVLGAGTTSASERMVTASWQYCHRAEIHDYSYTSDQYNLSLKDLIKIALLPARFRSLWNQRTSECLSTLNRRCDLGECQRTFSGETSAHFSSQGEKGDNDRQLLLYLKLLIPSVELLKVNVWEEMVHTYYHGEIAYIKLWL